MQSVIRIGSRESRLAVKQAEIIKDQIRRCDQTILVEIITMKTTGDKILDRSLESVGGKGLFVKELDQALADGRIDLAVHSLKDMPMEESSEFPILAYSRREDPRDVLIYKSEKKEQGTEEGSILTKTGAVIGTSSKRRMIQIQKLYPNAVFQGIRGNIQTRLSKLNKEEYDAAVLAAAGVKRLNMEAVIGRYFSVDEVIPAAGQGILVLGRRIYAVGGNEDAARLSGVSTAKVKLFVYVFCGILSGIAGILICSRITSGNGTVAEGYEMNAISAAVIGGVSMTGGSGNVLGSIVRFLLPEE